MGISRKSFLKSSLAGAAALAISCGGMGRRDDREGEPREGGRDEGPGGRPGGARGERAHPQANLNLAFQEWVSYGETLEEKLDFMESLGVVGLELGGGGLADRVTEIQKALQGRKVEVSAICAGFKEFLLCEDKARQKQCTDSVKEILAAAGELGSVGMILVPAFNHQSPCKAHTPETREFLVEQLRELGDYAASCNTSIILEPLNRKEAHYLRQVADAASICRDVNSKGLYCMGDFWHMTAEETSDMGAFISAGEYLKHVHVASRKTRKIPSQDGAADNYIEGFRALKMLGYKGHVSFECGCKEGEDRKAALTAAVELLRKQWSAEDRPPRG